jgi:dynein heavy chain
VTKKMTAEEVDLPSREGAYIVGLSMQGARWDVAAGVVDKARPKEMFCSMPVMVVRAVAADKADAQAYQCPVYKTEQRGPTYVFSAQLKTKSPAARWTMAGVGLIMDVAS